jgi:hypothetical protein
MISILMASIFLFFSVSMAIPVALPNSAARLTPNTAAERACFHLPVPGCPWETRGACLLLHHTSSHSAPY